MDRDALAAVLLPPMGGTVPEWGAARILAHAALGLPADVVAGLHGVSESTVERLVKAGGPDGVARVPQQGQGKSHDPRWVYSGHDGPGVVAALEHVMNCGSADELKQEVYQRWS